MRQIRHPGPMATQRVAAVVGLPVQLRFTLKPGDAVDHAIAEGFAASGSAGGFVMLDGGWFDPFKFVIPALSSDAQSPVSYSDTFEPKGRVQIRHGCAMLGLRDGEPLIHCHGIWDTTDGQRMGHMLAPDTKVAEPIVVTGIGLRNATFMSLKDTETNFMLFEPVRVADEEEPSPECPVLLAKVRPNEDICLAIEAICVSYGIRAANVFGIGSLYEVRFADGRSVPSAATEILINEGTVTNVAGKSVARLNIAAVDVQGALYEGELVRGDNPVCVAFELVIKVLEQDRSVRGR